MVKRETWNMKKLKKKQYALRANISEKAKRNITKVTSLLESEGEKYTIEQTVNHILETLKIKSI